MPSKEQGPNNWLLQLLKTLASFAMRHRISYQECTDLLKRAFVEQCASTMRESGDVVNVSRVSVGTGVHRKDVTRLLGDSDVASDVSLNEQESRRSKGLLPRVITQWRHDPRFALKESVPRPLVCEGMYSEFAELIRSVTSDIDYTTVLFQMERDGTVVKDGDTVTLQKRTYTVSADVEAGFDLLRADLNDLVLAVEENLLARKSPPNLHAKTEFDNIAIDALPLIREWLYEEGKNLHKKARSFLAQHDLDINRSAQSGQVGARVVIGSFSLVEEVSSRMVPEPSSNSDKRTSVKGKT